MSYHMISLQKRLVIGYWGSRAAWHYNEVVCLTQELCNHVPLLLDSSFTTFLLSKSGFQ